MIVAAVLDQIRDENHDPIFVIKGGVAMELRLGLSARATKDFDACYRAGMTGMLTALDEVITEPLADFRISRTEPREIGNTGALRIQIKLAYRTRSWGTVQLEVAAAEGHAGQEIDRVPAIPLSPFGLDGPSDIPCVAVRYQIAQKLHACTETFSGGPPNNRFRDLIDLIMLRDLISDDELADVRAACIELFELRNRHTWPPTISIPTNWVEEYESLAQEMDFAIRDVHDAAAEVQAIIGEINTAF